MCGIIGFIGKQQALPFLINGLKNLEYRGYDSAGISIKNNNTITTIKEIGEIKNLELSIPKNLQGNIGIGHTRWATHGEISQINSHPHISMNGNFSIVHNGIIENYIELNDELTKLGYKNQSTTDSEVIANLIDYYYSLEKNLLKAIIQTKNKLIGSYAIAIIEKNHNSLIAIRNKSPLCIGIISNQEAIVSSDPSSINKHTNNFIFLKDGEISILTKDNQSELLDIKVYNNDTQVDYKISTLNIIDDADSEDLKGYPNYMLKEIEEQPEVINKILNTYINQDNLFIKHNEINDILNSQTKNIWLVACGTSYFAGEYCLYLLHKYSKVNVFHCVASEFEQFSNKITKDCVIIAISQSGETADVIASLNIAKNKGAKIISLTNVSYSTIAQLSNLNIDIKAQRERSVASTKAFSASISVLYIIFLNFLYKQNEINQNQYNDFINDLKNISKTTTYVITKLQKDIEAIAKILSEKNKAIFLGKSANYIIAKEASLKLKELSYIYSDAIQGGELKHGPLALIEKDFPIISIFNNKNIIESKIYNNILETKSRGALNINITNVKTDNIDQSSNYNIYLNTDSEISFSINSAIVCQYLSYFTASFKKLNIDKPRNLAKSVTVE